MLKFDKRDNKTNDVTKMTLLLSLNKSRIFSTLGVLFSTMKWLTTCWEFENFFKPMFHFYNSRKYQKTVEMGA